MAVLTDTSPCVISTACDNGAGYRTLQVNTKRWLHHRLVWTEHHGPIPKGLLVRHLCHNKACINIKHLAIGTRKDNRQDDRDIGKWEPGQKLSEAQAREILDCKPIGKSPHRYMKRISEKYNIDRQTIYDIWKRDTWTHL